MFQIVEAEVYTLGQYHNFKDLINMTIRSLKHVLVIFLISVSSTWAEAASAECPGTNQVENNDCAAESFRQADGELNTLYKEQMKRLEAAPKTKDRLRDSQRAWVVFRDKACLYEAGTAEESGSMWPSENFGCMEYQTKKRIEDIKTYLACTDNGCPGN
jgi:uncharacterized protein YecT (DUF1311 family)